ncbi:MAG: FAD:protein FMN transferase [Microthrixaceae bacterium]
MAPQEARARVMGTDAHVVVVGGPVGPGAAIERLEELERTWSRFLPDSDISRLNAAAGAWVEVGPETMALLERAALAHDRTGGRFDPYRLRHVIRAGYGTAPGVWLEPSARPDPAEDGIGAVELDPEGSAARLPPGVGFDPGGIGKGYAADLVVAELRDAGAVGACVNVGGDLRVFGDTGGDGPWTVEVEDPADPDASLFRLAVADGAVCTSSRLRRRWLGADGAEAHHLIDPATGRPAVTEALSATVLAAEAWQAEALSKVAFLAGPDHFADLLADAGATGLVVTAEGAVPAGGLEPFVLPPVG